MGCVIDIGEPSRGPCSLREDIPFDRVVKTIQPHLGVTFHNLTMEHAMTQCKPRTASSSRDAPLTLTHPNAAGIDTVAMESTGVYWIPLFELLDARGLTVVRADAAIEVLTMHNARSSSRLHAAWRRSPQPPIFILA